MRLSGRQFAVIALGFAALGLLHGSAVYSGIRTETADPKYVYSHIATWEVACWLLWALLTPVVALLSRRVPLARRARPIVIHLLSSVGVAMVRALGICLLVLAIGPWGPSRPAPFILRYLGTLSSYFHLDLIVYWAIVGVLYAIDSRSRLRERELHSSRVETQLANAQLTNLRLQLQPHFLFNTLHSIASLVRGGDREAAVTMIAGLSDLLRYSLDNAGRNVVPLSEELEVVARYLEIQQTRFSDRLHIAINMADDTRDAAVPTLLLQPLVENAIRHGIDKSARAGRVEIRSRRDDGSLIVEVFGEGPPLAPDWRNREGVGLSSTRARLEQLYGTRGRLDLENDHGQGVIARVSIPFTRDLHA